MSRSLALIIGLMLITTPALSQDESFTQCISELQERAEREGIAPWIIAELMPELQVQSRVLELDRAQPEFTQTFADYLNRRVTKERVAQGKRLYDQYRSFLTRLTSRYSVPGHYLVAFWGMETNFGQYLGKMPTLDSLATLACDERRSDLFGDELITALKLLERESLNPDQMQGSWAGAMGHTQFMPSAYSSYAVDGDGDGKINLWDSERDALASGANYLLNLGWQKGERWGREVLLPPDFPYSETGLANRQSLKYWSGLGVRRADHRPLANVDMEGSIILPAGHKGPAFLVYENFHVIMGWNRSVSYALALGILRDRIAGAGNLSRPPSTKEAALSRKTIEEMQGKLSELGYLTGDVDGIIGPQTRSALRAFQLEVGFIPDGYPDSETLGALAKTNPASTSGG